MKRRAKGYTISAVAETYNVHPQTLRLYEREGLIRPSRSDGNTRLYVEEDLAQLEVILNLTRDLGVNLAGVQVVLNMRKKMDEMQSEFNRFFQFVSEYLAKDPIVEDPQFRTAMVRVRPESRSVDRVRTVIAKND